uniref:Uncharacterized protein n=1 Tax=Marmota marmota marmota TaxID=9994 RepID=A0A8C5Z082_MARMA
MWYPCILTRCHRLIMVTRNSFYGTYHCTVFHFTCKTHGAFSPSPFLITFPPLYDRNNYDVTYKYWVYTISQENRRIMVRAVLKK